MWPCGCQSCVISTWLNRCAELVDRRDDLVAAGHREAAAGQEIVLQVDDEQERRRDGA